MYSSKKLLTGRYTCENQFYSVTICTKKRTQIFKNFESACIAIRGLVYMQNKVNTICYTLMPDHLHWLFQLKDLPLNDVVRQYKSITTVNINKFNYSNGSIWQQNYFEHKLRTEEDLINQARYIVANPLRAKLVNEVGEYPFWDCVYL
ncbi:REP-associated tyrosine transposase [Pseudoalteromonas fuliginea]|uniref:Transposase n=1 Tax=Pseudoalteromonas fuliginea TaxID=1872678 RepID=A0ABQ6RDS1_9GAMM|nr:transposase [Pseudoalteromonas fuliginea]KAA1150899.1 transposase [Pseudoalteromonas fuliginea]KAA1165572.1 transposase [Pseudoalteromonas fuliginea]